MPSREHGEPPPEKRKYTRRQEELLDKLISDLKGASTADYWHDWVATKRSLGVKPLTALRELVEYATSKDIDPENLLTNGEYGVLGPSNGRKLSTKNFSDALERLENEVREKSQNESIANDDDANSGTVIEAASGMDAELPTLDDEARNSKSISPDASPRGKPCKEQRPRKHIDITSDPISYKEQNVSPFLVKRANKVISQMSENVMLTDDVLMELAEFLTHSYPESKSRLLDSQQFKVDAKDIPPKLKHPPEQGQKLYLPLCHSSEHHWTLCVLMFGNELIRLDFYDSLEDEARASRVQSFFTNWIDGRYHGSNLEFTIKEAPQQNDCTSCGIFALEIMRRLLSSEDVKQPIEPMEVRRALLQRTTSIDTTSPPAHLPEYTLQTLQSIQKYSPIRAIIDKISAAAGPQRASFANLLPHAEEESTQTTEEINGLKRNLEDAQGRLRALKTKEVDTKKILAKLSSSITVNETADFSVALHSGMRGDEQVADDGGEPSAKRPRISEEANISEEAMEEAMAQGVKNLVSQYSQYNRQKVNSRIQESMDKILDEVRKSVEEAEKKEKEIAEQLDRLRSHADSVDAIASLCRGYSHFENIGVDVPTITSNMIQRQAQSDFCD